MFLSLSASLSQYVLRQQCSLKYYEAASSTRGQTAEARRTTILQPAEQKPQSQKGRQNQKAEDYVPDEGTR